MEKKEYKKPQINVIAVNAVGIMAGSERIPIGRPGSGNEPETDENGNIWGD